MAVLKSLATVVQKAANVTAAITDTQKAKMALRRDSSEYMMPFC